MRALVLTVLLGGCAERAQIVLPAHYLRQPQSETPTSQFSVKLEQSDRTWNVSLPAVSPGYEVRLPAAKGEVKSPGNDKSVGPKMTRDSAEFRKAMAHIQTLFQKKDYEAALVEVVKLRGSFPDDANLWSMEGTLQWKLGNKQKAQEAWEKVMSLDPQNERVLEMLEGMQ